MTEDEKCEKKRPKKIYEEKLSRINENRNINTKRVMKNFQYATMLVKIMMMTIMMIMILLMMMMKIIIEMMVELGLLSVCIDKEKKTQHKPKLFPIILLSSSTKHTVDYDMRLIYIFCQHTL